MKRILALILAAMMIVSLTACGNKSETENSNKTNIIENNQNNNSSDIIENTDKNELDTTDNSDTTDDSDTTDNTDNSVEKDALDLIEIGETDSDKSSKYTYITNDVNEFNSYKLPENLVGQKVNQDLLNSYVMIEEAKLVDSIQINNDTSRFTHLMAQTDDGVKFSIDEINYPTVENPRFSMTVHVANNSSDKTSISFKNFKINDCEIIANGIKGPGELRVNSGDRLKIEWKISDMLEYGITSIDKVTLIGTRDITSDNDAIRQKIFTVNMYPYSDYPTEIAANTINTENSTCLLNSEYGKVTLLSIETLDGIGLKAKLYIENTGDNWYTFDGFFNPSNTDSYYACGEYLVTLAPGERVIYNDYLITNKFDDTRDLKYLKFAGNINYIDDISYASTILYTAVDEFIPDN